MSKYEDFSDADLMQLLQTAIELRDGKYIKSIKKEISRRNAE